MDAISHLKPYNLMRLISIGGGFCLFLALLISFPASAALPNETLAGGVSRLQQLYDQLQQTNQARLQENPDDLEALLSLGQLYLFRTDYDNAIRYFRRAVEAAPQNPLGHFSLGRCLLERGWDTEEGVRVLNTALRLALAQDPPGVPLPDTYYSLARAYYFDGQYNQALAAVQAVKQADPHFPEIYYLSGQIYYAQSQMALARQEFQREIQENPRHAGSYFYLSFCYEQAGQRDNAIAALQRTAELNPLYEGVHRWLGYYQNLNGNTGQAVEHYQEALRRDPQDVSLLQDLAALYYRNRQYNLAAGQLQRSLAIYPENFQAASLLADCYRAMNNPAAARAVLRKAKHFSFWYGILYLFCLAVPALLAAVRSRAFLKKIQDIDDTEERVRRYHAFRQWCSRILGVGIFGLAALYYAFHLDYIGLAYGIKHFSLLAHILVILSLFTSVHIVFIRVDRAVRQTRAGIRDYLRIYFGMIFLIALQWSVIVAALTMVSREPGRKGIVVMSLIVLAAAVYGYTALFPRLMKIFFKLRPCPADIKARLRKTCERVGLSLEDIPVLETSGIKMANAAATGLGKGNYYVYLTSYLLEVLSPEELEAIFLHECGHLKKNHVRIQAHLLFAAVVIIVGVLRVSAPLCGGSALLLAAGVLLVYLVFRSVLSQKQERETDEFAADHSEDPSALSRALEKLYLINYVPKDWKAPRHPALTKRLEYIRQRIRAKNPALLPEPKDAGAQL